MLNQGNYDNSGNPQNLNSDPKYSIDANGQTQQPSSSNQPGYQSNNQQGYSRNNGKSQGQGKNKNQQGGRNGQRQELNAQQSGQQQSLNTNSQTNTPSLNGNQVNSNQGISIKSPGSTFASQQKSDKNEELKSDSKVNKEEVAKVEDDQSSRSKLNDDTNKYSESQTPYGESKTASEPKLERNYNNYWKDENDRKSEDDNNGQSDR